MLIVIGSAPWAIGSADRKHTESAILFRASLLTSVCMTPAYGPGTPFGELRVTRRTGVLRAGPGGCGLVLGDVRKAACTESRHGSVGNLSRCPGAGALSKSVETSLDAADTSVRATMGTQDTNAALCRGSKSRSQSARNASSENSRDSSTHSAANSSYCSVNAAILMASSRMSPSG
jgi:hypothetical protein